MEVKVSEIRFGMAVHTLGVNMATRIGVERDKCDLVLSSELQGFIATFQKDTEHPIFIPMTNVNSAILIPKKVVDGSKGTGPSR